MKLTWFGHSAVRVEGGSHVVLIDPFLKNNPKFDASFEEATAGVTHVVLTHGHDDHVGDAVEICQARGAALIAAYELAMYLHGLGVQKVEPANPGGGILLSDGVCVNFVKAFHSSSTTVDGRTIYLGNPCGVVVQGLGKTVYHMGDTEIFGDMALIQELFAPQIGLVPIGDRFTMGAKAAALACKKFFNFEAVVPIHYGTFPVIAQDPAPFLAEFNDQKGKVLIPEIGRPVEF